MKSMWYATSTSCVCQPHISLNTVATHVRNILTKTGTVNRTEAAAYALRHGLLAK